uniref:Uncharacterized protein n=1 Tax=Cacopsylla melanoneura TaxID=428564 RepID=A0A8D8SPH9_9HEMI
MEGKCGAAECPKIYLGNLSSELESGSTSPGSQPNRGEPTDSESSRFASGGERDLAQLRESRPDTPVCESRSFSLSRPPNSRAEQMPGGQRRVQREDMSICKLCPRGQNRGSADDFDVLEYGNKPGKDLRLP